MSNETEQFELIDAKNHSSNKQAYWVDGDSPGFPQGLAIADAPHRSVASALQNARYRFPAASEHPLWHIVRGGDERRDAEPIPRAPIPASNLLLAEDIRQRVEQEVLRFFDEPVARLHAELQVPHRRGVLLHGPPGNGKTSLIRHVGASLPNAYGMILRPDARFTIDGLTAVVERWKHNAPAILVVEDLDWLLHRFNVSTFLNLVDGIDTAVSGGLLLIGSTNHPNALDSAVNNRPGRFDVVIEVRSPETDLRRAFFRNRLVDFQDDVIEQAVQLSDGLSFAHLQEVLRLSGMSAIAGGRTARTEVDLLRAVNVMRNTNADAEAEFKPRLKEFGLGHLRSLRKKAAGGSK